jgi:hypothetical protein
MREDAENHATETVVCNETCNGLPPTVDEHADPSDALGPETDRDRTTGRFVRGNRAAVITGSRSVKFWQAAEVQREQLTLGILRDRGFASLADAPVALRLAAQGAAQAQIVRDSAFARLVECGGPLSGSDRERGAHKIWAAACDRLLRHVQTLGYERVPPALPTLADYMAQSGGDAA